MLTNFPKPKHRKLSVKNETLNADIAVVGAGAAGQTATIRASQLGKKVILIEKSLLLGALQRLTAARL